jgi:flavin reductase (DIM6/NTAB) family NADH-FMN oxidoreductase RutF
MTNAGAAMSTIQDVFTLLDREIWILTAQAGPQRAGLVVTLVSQASIVRAQPRVWVGLSPQHFTTAVVQASQGFRLHLVAPEQAELVWRFGTTSGHDMDKFAEANWPDSQWGRPELVGAVGWLECGIESQVETGDRVFFLARVLAGERCRDLAPLTLH